MPRDIRFFGLIGSILLIGGIIMVYLSGKVTTDIITRRSTPTPKIVITAIVVTQTRLPHNPWQGNWSCDNNAQTSLQIVVDGSFYTVTDSQNKQLVAVLSGAELRLEDGRVMRLNSQENMLIVKTSDETSYFCTLNSAVVPTPAP